MKTTTLNIFSRSKKISNEHLFMITMVVVNAGNYLYNLLLGRILGPEAFADAAILITFLLVLSFLGMTFQVGTAKYAVLFEKQKLQLFISKVTKYALLVGLIFGIVIMVLNAQIQIVFHTKTATMFVVFAISIPFYFLMSVNRGLYQGNNALHKLSITYITEMFSRLLLTLTAVLLFPTIPTSIIVAAGISVSIVFGLLPFQKALPSALIKRNIDSVLNSKNIITFFALTAFYELTQIIINNSDIILVKHYFSDKEAGLYASLALIGRVVYFVAWMFVMLLLPKVIQYKKEGKETLPILMKYVAYICVLSTGIVLFTFLFPEFVVTIMFGEKYLSIAFLLWKYAFATSVFAIANIFAYYFLSINQYIPVVVSAILGLTQIGLIVGFHESLQQVVEMQIIAMVLLLFFQLFYFFYQNKKSIQDV
jgi:O-antigen/teichoic acid export membrane protein